MVEPFELVGKTIVCGSFQDVSLVKFRPGIWLEVGVLQQAPGTEVKPSGVNDGDEGGSTKQRSQAWMTCTCGVAITRTVKPALRQ